MAEVHHVLWECLRFLYKYSFLKYFQALKHRRRMELEDKAKVVASVWGGGAEFGKFLAALAVLPWSI